MIPVASLHTPKYGLKIQIGWIGKLDHKIIEWLKLVCYLNMDAKCREFFLSVESVVSKNLFYTQTLPAILCGLYRLSLLFLGFVFPLQNFNLFLAR